MNVLVVDDEEGIRNVLRDTLSRRGHSVVCAENGVEAVSCVASGDLDAVFLDIRMPGGDGLTALKEMQDLRPALPVIVMTGCAQEDVRVESVNIGAYICLIKPFSTLDVLAMLDILQSDKKTAAA